MSSSTHPDTVLAGNLVRTYRDQVDGSLGPGARVENIRLRQRS